MFTKVFRLVLVLGLLGSIGWYVWHGLTTVPVDEWDSPWSDSSVVPGIAVALFFTLYSLPGLRSAMRGGNSAAMRSAPIGIGTVTGVQRTGLTVNDAPQLLISMTVRTADGHVFESSAKQLVDLMELGLFTPGAVLPVRYRPGHTDHVEIDKSGDQAQAQAVHNQVMIRMGVADPRHLEIAERGIQARAVVAAARPTGQLVAGNPKFSVTLLVTRPDGSTYETTVEKVVVANLIGFVQVGRVLTVYYLPGAEHEVALQMPANPHA